MVILHHLNYCSLKIIFVRYTFSYFQFFFSRFYTKFFFFPAFSFPFDFLAFCLYVADFLFLKTISHLLLLLLLSILILTGSSLTPSSSSSSFFFLSFFLSRLVCFLSVFCVPSLLVVFYFSLSHCACLVFFSFLLLFAFIF